ncbi:ribonuclease H [Rickettsiales bacterium]|nr:ribonuclease H [Rickettsiales bacterium]
MEDKENRVIIYTDGACSGNPGPGGWAAILIYKGTRKEVYGGKKLTTNNKMELTAAIEALSSIKKPHSIIIHTDSTYLKQGITLWLEKWRSNNWKTSDKKPVKNLDLWLLLEKLTKKHQVQWNWVKAHDGNEENERADQLAKHACSRYK